MHERQQLALAGEKPRLVAKVNSEPEDDDLLVVAAIRQVCSTSTEFYFRERDWHLVAIRGAGFLFFVAGKTMRD